jgi:hypothetical protein
MNYKWFQNFLLLSLLSLALLWVAGIGRYDYAPRSNAFFNDPNQMAFWALCICCSYFFLNIKAIKTWQILAVLSLTFVILLSSASRSALVGFSFIILGVILTFLKDFKTSLRFIVIIIPILILLVLFTGIDYILEQENIKFMVDRTEATDIARQSEVRGYTRLINYPEYLFLGAGHGGDYRFNATHEIHSSWAGLIFYYGIPGTLTFLLFLYSLASKLPLNLKAFFCAPLLYGFSTFGIRTPVFWLFLSIVALYILNKKRNLNNDES